MTESLSLDQVLAGAREDANRLRYHGHKAQADSIDRVCDAVAEAMAPYLEWLSEEEARSRSARGADYFRSRFAEWEALGLAEVRNRKRFYRRLIVPRRANLEAARRQAERDALEGAA